MPELFCREHYRRRDAERYRRENIIAHYLFAGALSIIQGQYPMQRSCQLCQIAIGNPCYLPSETWNAQGNWLDGTAIGSIASVRVRDLDGNSGIEGLLDTFTDDELLLIIFITLC